MECKKFRDLFSDYIDHQLNKEELKIFEKHMEECTECRNEFYKFEKMLLKLKQIKDFEPPKVLKSKIMTSVMSEENKRLNAKILNFRKYSSVAATFIIAFIGFAIYQAFTLNKISEENNHKSLINDSIKTRAMSNVPFDDSQEKENNKDAFSTLQNPIEEKSKNSVVNLYSKGLEVTIITTNIDSAKNFLVSNIENIKTFEEMPKYIEFVLNKEEFLNLEESFNHIYEYQIYFENIDFIKSEIDKIINEKIITEEGLIKFKVILEKQEKS